jgi:hypothetical protein
VAVQAFNEAGMDTAADVVSAFVALAAHLSTGQVIQRVILVRHLFDVRMAGRTVKAAMRRRCHGSFVTGVAGHLLLLLQCVGRGRDQQNETQSKIDE